MVIFLHLFQTSHKIIHAVAKYRTKSTVFHRLCHGRAMHVHIKCRRHSTGQIFHHRQLCQPVYILICQLRFRRKYTLIQPLIQFHIICMRTQKCHRRMCMCIFKSGKDQISFRIDFFVPGCIFRFFNRRPHVADHISVDPEFSFEDFVSLFHCQNPGIIYSCLHLLLLSLTEYPFYFLLNISFLKLFYPSSFQQSLSPDAQMLFRSCPLHSAHPDGSVLLL